MSLSHRPATRAVRRLLATTAASAMVIALGPLVGPAAAQVSPRGVDTVCPPPGQEELPDAFTDDEASVHERSINCAAAYDIALGVTSTQYQPQINTKRDQMASFIARLIRTAGQNLPDNPPDAFTDDEQSVHENNINALAAVNVVLGVSSTQYNPNAAVRRDAMASFINRAIDYVDDGQVNGSLPPDTTNDFFTDDEQSVHEENINELAEQAIVAGRGNQQYDPNDLVDRAAMATFLMQGADFLAERGLWAPFGDVTITGLQEGAELEQGEQVTVTVAAEGETITQVRVLGCGVDETVATDADLTAEGFQVQFTIPAGQTAGDCTLRFIVTTADGDTLEERVTVTIVAPVGNQAFTVSPEGDVTVEAGGPGETFTVTGIDVANVDLALVPCDNVTVGAGGVVTFVDANADDLADGIPGDDTPAIIAKVNGVDVTSASTGFVNNEFINDVAVVNGAVQFTVTSDTPTCVVGVVFDDPDNDNALDLGADDRPIATELFAVTGDVTFTAPLAAAGDFTAVNVLSNDEAANSFVGCPITGGQPGPDETVNAAACATFTYDANDRFFVGTATTANQLTMAEFELRLTQSDDVSGTFLRDQSLQSEFILTDEAPLAPEAVAVQSKTNTSVTLDIDDSATTSVDAYRILRVVDTTTNGVCPTTGLTEIGVVQDPTPTRNASPDILFTDQGLAPSTQYCYRVVSIDDGDEGGAIEIEVTTNAQAADTVAPLSTDAFVVSDLNSELSNGDVLRAVFNEQMRPVDDGDAVRVQDPDGEIKNITCDGPPLAADALVADCFFNDRDVVIDGTTFGPGRVLTIQITATDPITADNTVVGGDNRIDYPATATATFDVTVGELGFVDLAGNPWNFADSPDRIFDNEGAKTQTGEFNPAATEPQALDTRLTTDASTTGVLDTNDVVRITYDESMVGGVDAGDNIQVDATPGNTADEATTQATIALVATCATTVNTASFVLNDNILVLTLCAPTDADLGTLGNQTVAVPATIETQTGITDGEGNTWDPAGDPDVVIDVE